MSEIGTSTTIQVDREYLLHIQAQPLEFARFLQKLITQLRDEEGNLLSQRGLARYLRDIGYSIRQPQIHRYLSILLLEPRFIKKVKNKEMAFLTAYKLSRLPPEQRIEVEALAKEEKTKRIYDRHVESVRRRHLNSEEVMKMLMTQEGFDQPYDDEATSDLKEVSPKRDDLPSHEPEATIPSSELSSTLSMLKMRANDEIIRANDVHILFSKYNPLRM